MKNVFLRRDVYQFRIRIPKHLQNYFNGKKLYIKSMRTKSKVRALSFSKILLKKFNYIKDNSLMGMPKEEIEKLVFEFCNTLLEETEEDLYNTPDPESTQLAWDLDDIITNYQNEYFYGKEDNYPLIQSQLAKLLDQNPDMNVTADDLKVISKTMISRFIDDLKEIKTKINKGTYKKPKPKITTQVVSTSENVQAGVTSTGAAKNQSIEVSTPVVAKYRLDDCCDKFIENWKKDRKVKGYTEDNLGQWEYQLTLLKMFFGDDKDVYTITEDEMENYRDLLTEYPKAFTQKNFFKGKDLDYVIANSEEFEKISGTTADKYIIKINNIFQFFSKKGFTPQLFKLKKFNVKGETRLKFDKADLQKIYTHLLTETDENKFIIAIMMFMGTRLKEVTQLTKEDVLQEDGFWYIDINRKDKKTTKNENSVRRVPIHDKLIESGFLDYVNNCKRKNLFKITNKEFSKYFREKVKPKITEVRLKTLYSLRHNFITDILNEGSVKVEHLAATVGHEKQYKITMGTYGSQLPVKLLKKEVIDKLTYDFK